MQRRFRRFFRRGQGFHFCVGALESALFGHTFPLHDLTCTDFFPRRTLGAPAQSIATATKAGWRIENRKRGMKEGRKIEIKAAANISLSAEVAEQLHSARAAAEKIS
jgi:hypothetical protein